MNPRWWPALLLCACAGSRPAPSPVERLEARQESLEALVEELSRKVLELEGRQQDSPDRPAKAAESDAGVAPPPPKKSFLDVGEGPKGKTKLTNEDLRAFDRRRAGEVGAAYDDAYRAFTAGDYDAAVRKMTAFAAKYPDEALTGNALYWTGEAHYRQRRFTAALDRFSDVMKKFPSGAKAPDALLKIGATYRELGKMDRARENFAQAARRFPESEAGREAKVELQKLGGQGEGNKP